MKGQICGPSWAVVTPDVSVPGNGGTWGGLLCVSIATVPLSERTASASQVSVRRSTCPWIL